MSKGAIYSKKDKMDTSWKIVELLKIFFKNQ